jgi:DNA polymerase-3 subunit delta'
MAEHHPRSVSSLFGFHTIESELAEQFCSGTLHHSLLITGAKGIGKATLAYRFARFILSGGADLAERESHPFSLFEPEVSDGKSDGDGVLFMPQSHGIFKRVASNSHPDLLTIEPAFDAKKGVYKSEIQAEVAREMGDFLALTPSESDYRVVIIDAADQLNEKAANALLKSIEEPPERAYVLIVCHNPRSILPTIRSRCRQVTLPTPDLAAFAAVLRTQGSTLDFTQYDMLRALSFGSPGFAITLAQQHAHLMYQTAVDILSRTPSIEAIQPLAAELASGKTAESWEVATHVVLQVIERVLRHGQGAIIPMFEGEAEALSRISQRLNVLALLDLRDKALQLFATTDSLNLDKQAAIISVLRAAA